MARPVAPETRRYRVHEGVPGVGHQPGWYRGARLRPCTGRRRFFLPEEGAAMTIQSQHRSDRSHVEAASDGVPRYDPAALEPGWQERWRTQGLHRADERGGRPKYYCLDFFPYPSGESLS